MSCIDHPKGVGRLENGFLRLQLFSFRVKLVILILYACLVSMSTLTPEDQKAFCAVLDEMKLSLSATRNVIRHLLDECVTSPTHTAIYPLDAFLCTSKASQNF